MHYTIGNPQRYNYCGDPTFGDLQQKISQKVTIVIGVFHAYTEKIIAISR